MEIKIKKNKKGCSASEVKQLEELFGYELPNDYKDFMIEYNGGEPNSNVFSIPEEQNESGVNKFFSQKEIIKEKKILGNRIGIGVIPIADAACGNIVCLSLINEKKGVYFWDHELEDEEENLPSWKNMFYLAESFKDFMNKLRRFNPDEIELEPGQVLEVWVDPEFLKEINKKKQNRK